MRTGTFGGLTVRITGGTDGDGGGDGPLVVLQHGFGAPGDDLVPLAAMFGLPRAVRFAFPAAPLELGGYFGGDSRAWWMIDVDRLERDMAAGPGAGVTAERERRADEEPAGLTEAREALTAALDELQEELAVPAGKLALGGFSQGAMLSCDLALRDGRPLAALVLMSGTLIAAPIWRSGAPARAGLPVLVSHGRQDPLLPFALSERLRDLLREAGLEVEWLPFRGGHEIPPAVLQQAGQLLHRVLA